MKRKYNFTFIVKTQIGYETISDNKQQAILNFYKFINNSKKEKLNCTLVNCDKMRIYLLQTDFHFTKYRIVAPTIIYATITATTKRKALINLLYELNKEGDVEFFGYSSKQIVCIDKQRAS